VLTGLNVDDVDENMIRPQAGECLRKEYRTLTKEEKDALHKAINEMKEDGNYSLFVRHHRPRESPAAHFGVAFIGWHRVYLILYVSSGRLGLLAYCD